MHFEHFSLTSLSRIQIIHFRKDKRLSLKFSTKSQTVKCRKNFGSKNIAQGFPRSVIGSEPSGPGSSLQIKFLTQKNYLGIKQKTLELTKYGCWIEWSIEHVKESRNEILANSQILQNSAKALSYFWTKNIKKSRRSNQINLES